MYFPTCTHPQCFRPRPCPVHPKIQSAAPRVRDIRLYFTKRWKRFRKRYLEEHPFCVHCLSESSNRIGIPLQYTLATEIDHIIDIRDGGLEYEDSNLQGLCKRHHAIKTRQHA